MYSKSFEKKNGIEILLSICIPTYNRKKYLTEIVQKLIDLDFPDNFELVISDNGSTDNTIESLTPLFDKLGNVTVFSANGNMGPDRNFINSINISSGKYFWLLGSDDMPLEGYKSIPDVIADGDFLMLNFLRGDKNLKTDGKHNWFKNNVDNFKLDTSIPKNQAYIFNEAAPLWGFYFGYISSIVFKREKWDTIPFDDEWYGTFFSFSYVIYRAIFSGITFSYSKDFICLKNRNYNDSMGAEFEGDVYFNRLKIDFVAFFNIYNQITDVDVKGAYRGLMERNYKYQPLVQYRYRLSKEKWDFLRSNYFVHFLPKNTIFLFDHIMPLFKNVYFFLYKLKKSLYK